MFGAMAIYGHYTKADLKLAKTTYDRISALYEDSIVSVQRRDEVEAIYRSALAAERAAYYQYQIAKEGVQEQDKASAKEMAKAAEKNAEVVKSLLKDSKLTSPISGQIATIALNVGELSSIGTSIMTIVDIENPYLVLNVREDLLKNFKMGNDILCEIPALGLNEVPFTINYISPLGSFATWKATKDSGAIINLLRHKDTILVIMTVSILRLFITIECHLTSLILITDDIIKNHHSIFILNKEARME